MQSSRNRGMSLGIQGENYFNRYSNPHNDSNEGNISFCHNHGHNLAYNQDPSLAEKNLQRYGPDKSSNT